MPPVAAVGASLVGGIAGNILEGNATRKAGDMQQDAANSAADLQKQMFDKQSANLQPYQAAGTSALSQMGDPYFQQNFSMADFQQDPAYQFNLQQGQQAIERSAAAKGGLASGGTLKDLNNYAQGMASNEYQNAYNRFTNNQNQRFGRLSSLAGLGQNANQQFGQASQNYANMWGEDMMGGANAQAAATRANGQMWGNTMRGLGNMGGQQIQGASAMGGSGGGGGGFGIPSSGGFSMPAFGG